MWPSTRKEKFRAFSPVITSMPTSLVVTWLQAFRSARRRAHGSSDHLRWRVPARCNLYQISKALICAKNILKRGGTIVVACECPEGLGSIEFCGIMRSVCSPREFFEGYCDPKNFVFDQWCAQNIYQVLDYAGKVYIYSPGLSHEDVLKMGAIKIENVQSTVTKLLDAMGGRLWSPMVRT
jgi:hypothetical protein